jgi:hypothetical protein
MHQVHIFAKEVIDELERLQKPDFEEIQALEHVLSEVFALTQAEVHVITGSLRGSGKTWSDFDGEAWEGGVSYGGPSMGFINDPVEYAFYEWRRGGAHDFFGHVHTIDHRFSDAIIEGHLEE